MDYAHTTTSPFQIQSSHTSSDELCLQSYCVSTDGTVFALTVYIPQNMRQSPIYLSPYNLHVGDKSCFSMFALMLFAVNVCSWAAVIKPSVSLFTWPQSCLSNSFLFLSLFRTFIRENLTVRFKMCCFAPALVPFLRYYSHTYKSSQSLHLQNPPLLTALCRRLF